MVKRLKNQMGFSEIILPIVLLSVFAILQMIYINTITQRVNQNLRYKAKQSLDIILQNYITNISNDEILRVSNTLPENDNIKCTLDGTCTYSAAPMPFKLVNLKGEVLSGPGNTGIGSHGTLCNGNDDTIKCPFIAEVYWRPLCPFDNSPCINPSVEITVDIKQTDYGLIKYNFNLAEYSYTRTVANFSLLAP